MKFCQHTKKTLFTMVLLPAKRRAVRALLLLTIFCVAAPVLIYRIFSNSDLDADNLIQSSKHGRYINAYRNSKDTLDFESNYVRYNRNIPLIWIGGVPRSGTTLARAMLDAHPHIRCGEETRVIPRMLSMHGHMLKSDLEKARLEAAKVTDDVIDSALGAYMLSIIVGHGEPAKRLCNKDPFTLKSMPRLLNIFPNSKFILMIRDGRATVHSIVTRKVTIRGFNHTSYAAALRDWNKVIEKMYTSCMKQEQGTCLPVRYEQLVLHPRKEMNRILNFLDVEWNEAVLHHEDAIGKAGGISLSKRELSTDQVNKPVNVGALIKWVEHFPDDVKKDIDQLAPMLKQLGYDSKMFPPFYGTPDKEVAEQSKRLQLQQGHLAPERTKVLSV